MSYDKFFGGYYENGTEITDVERIGKINDALETLRKEAAKPKAGFFTKVWNGIKTFGGKVVDVLKDGRVETSEVFELISDVDGYVKGMKEGTEEEKKAKKKEFEDARKAIENVSVKTKSGKEFKLTDGADKLKDAINRKNKENVRAGKESTSKIGFGFSIGSFVVGLVAVVAFAVAPFTGFASLAAPFALAGFIGGGTLAGIGAAGAIGWGVEKHNLNKGQEASDKEKAFKALRESDTDGRNKKKVSELEVELLNKLKEKVSSIESLDKFAEVLAEKEKAAEGKDENSAEAKVVKELKAYESKVNLILAAKKDGKADKTVGEMIAECGKEKRSYWGYKNLVHTEHKDKELKEPATETKTEKAAAK